MDDEVVHENHNIAMMRSSSMLEFRSVVF